MIYFIKYFIFLFIKKYKNLIFLMYFPVLMLWTIITGLQFGAGTDYFNYLRIYNDSNYLKLYFRIK